MPTKRAVKPGSRLEPLSGESLLLEAAKDHPGVAELVRLYELHTATIQRATPYLINSHRTVTFTAGSTSA